MVTSNGIGVKVGHDVEAGWFVCLIQPSGLTVVQGHLSYNAAKRLQADIACDIDLHSTPPIGRDESQRPYQT